MTTPTDWTALARARWESEHRNWSWDELVSTFRAYLVGAEEEEAAPTHPTVCRDDKCMAPIDVRDGVELCLRGHRHALADDEKPKP